MHKIKLAEIKPPTWYIRHRMNQSHFEDLLSVAKDSPKWPFPPILVSRLTPEEIEDNKKNKKLSAFRYEATDGWHRINVATTLKMTSIDATISDLKTLKDRFLAQYRTNAFTGLRLDRDVRDEAIRHMRKEFKLSERTIAKEVGLSQKSVNRILRNIQRGSKAKAEREKEREAFADSPSEVLQRLHMSLSNFIELGDSMSTFLETGLENESIPIRVLDDLEKMATRILEIIKELGT